MMYKFAKDPGAKGIPLEPVGDGEVPSHWATAWAAPNANFFDIMASYISQDVVGRYVSTVTVGAMQDLGYQVNYAEGDLDWFYTEGKYLMLRKSAPVSADGKSYPVTVLAGQVQGGLDFGVKLKSVTFPTGPKPPVNGTISGISFIDTNRNGRKDRGEAVLKCTIFFDLDHDGVLDSNEPRIKIKSGAYRFTQVPEGTWRLGVLLPKGLKLSGPIKPVKITAAKPNVK